MGKIETFPPVPPAAVTRVLATFDRDQLAGFIAVAIDLLDLAEGDPDLENATDLEDDFTLSADAVAIARRYPDQDRIDQDAGAWIEWETLRKNLKGGPNIMAGHEDDEEDDPSGVCDEDGINTELHLPREDHGPGCTISDPDMCDVERDDVTTYENFYQGEGSARHEDDDEEPWRVPPHWPLGDGEGFRFRPAPAND